MTRLQLSRLLRIIGCLLCVAALVAGHSLGDAVGHIYRITLVPIAILCMLAGYLIGPKPEVPRQILKE